MHAAIFAATVAVGVPPNLSLPEWALFDLSAGVTSKRDAFVLVIDRRVVDAAHQPGKPMSVELASQRSLSSPRRPGVDTRPIPTVDRGGGGGSQHTNVHVEVARACAPKKPCRIPVQARRAEVSDQAAGRNEQLQLRIGFHASSAHAPEDAYAEVRGAEVTLRGRFPPPPPARPPAPKPPRNPNPPEYACESNEDCVATCAIPNECCAGQCQSGCEFAVNRRHLEQVEKRHRAHCKKVRCPAVGCAMDDTVSYGAACKDGRCEGFRTSLGGSGL